MAYRRVIPLIALLSTIVVLHSSDVADVSPDQRLHAIGQSKMSLMACVLSIASVLCRMYRFSVYEPIVPFRFVAFRFSSCDAVAE